MRVVVVGAQGRTGALVVAAAERAGHEVVRVTRAEADATDAEALRPHLVSADAVVSCVGPSRRSPDGILERSTLALLDAGATRLITISASGPYTEGDGVVLARVVKPLLWRVFGGTWRDMRASDGVLAASGIRWTSVRPPRLVDRPARGHRSAYGVNVRRGIRIGRADLADAVVASLDDPRAVRTSVSVAN